MKKVLLFLMLSILTSFAFISCSDDDDDSKAYDPIIGTWYLYSIDGEEISDCVKKSTTSYTDTKFSSAVYSKDDNGNCELIDSMDTTWKNNGKDSYTTNGGEEMTNSITFSDNNQTYS